DSGDRSLFQNSNLYLAPLREFFEKCLCVSQDGGVEPVREPGVGRRQRLSRLGGLALRVEEAAQAYDGRQPRAQHQPPGREYRRLLIGEAPAGVACRLLEIGTARPWSRACSKCMAGSTATSLARSPWAASRRAPIR